MYSKDLERYAFKVSAETFYGGVFSDGEPDALTKLRECPRKHDFRLEDK